MEVVCPIDAQFAHQISLLLEPPSPLQVHEYFNQLTTRKQFHGIQVKPTNDHGKGVYADVDFEEEDLVLKDQMLAGMQHSSNKIDCLVCGCCFCFIGSIEVQIGRKLYLQNLGSSKDAFFDEKLELLMNEKLDLPHSKEFPLPAVINCPGGCKEVFYCSKSCAEADWDACHSLLYTGEGSKSFSNKALSKFIQHANGKGVSYLTNYAQILSYVFVLLLDLLSFLFLSIIFSYQRRMIFSSLLPSDLVVASPVEDYFLYIDDLPEAEKKKLMK